MEGKRDTLTVERCIARLVDCRYPGVVLGRGSSLFVIDVVSASLVDRDR
jgi:hypothetical protein